MTIGAEIVGAWDRLIGRLARSAGYIDPFQYRIEIERAIETPQGSVWRIVYSLTIRQAMVLSDWPFRTDSGKKPEDVGLRMKVIGPNDD